MQKSNRETKGTRSTNHPTNERSGSSASKKSTARNASEDDELENDLVEAGDDEDTETSAKGSGNSRSSSRSKK